MDCIRMVERSMSKASVLDMNSFPPLDEKEQKKLQKKRKNDYLNKGKYFIRTWENKWFLDIYLRCGGAEPKRFIIAPGYMMPMEDEDEFVSCLMKDWFDFGQRAEISLAKKIMKIAPELHMKEYYSMRSVLLHTYFCSHQSGIREQLYKMGLDLIALAVEDIPYNVLGTNVETAFDMPLALMKKMNTMDCVYDVLMHTEEKSIATKIYRKYHSLLNDIDTMNGMQYEYLKYCYLNNSDVDKKMLKHLRTAPDVSGDMRADLLTEIHQYCKYQEQVGGTIFPKYPPLGDLMGFHALLDALQEYIHRGDIMNMCLAGSGYESEHKYAYEDEEYIVCAPKTLRDVIEEAENMHNCLNSYINELTARQTEILFIRRKKKKNKSLIDVEVKNGEITQAFQACNKALTEEQKSFIEKFAAAKDLLYKPNPSSLDEWEGDMPFI